MKKHLSIEFYGTRGNAPPVYNSPKYGVNTTAAAITSGSSASIIVDLGTGAVRAAKEMFDNGVREFTVFLTHLHIDHINGLFGFPPIYDPNCKIKFYSDKKEIESVFHTLMQQPIHPVPYKNLAANFEYIHLEPEGELFLEEHDLTVSWRQQNHPQGSLAYRFDNGESAIVFATDVEFHKWDIPDSYKSLFTKPFVAQIAAIDAFFDDDEVHQHRGWGHNSWSEAKAFSDECGCKTLILIHHHPLRSDDEMKKFEQEHKNIIMAKEGQCIKSGG